VRRLAVLLALLAFPGFLEAAQVPVRRAAAAPPSAAAAMARAERLLEDASAPAGTLPVACRIALASTPEGGAPTTGAGQVVFEVTLALDREAPPAGPFRVTLLAATLEGDLTSAQRTLALAAGMSPETGPDSWTFREALEVGDELYGAVAVVEDLASGEWGAVTAELAEDLAWHAPAPPDAAPPTAAGPAPTTPPDPQPSAPAPARPTARAAPAPPAPSPAARVIALLPPRERPATGRTRFQTLITTDAIDRVEFFLDGEPAGADETAPYSVTLDLGPEARPHTVRAVAYERSGRVLGEHTLELNRASARAFSVTIRELAATPAGSWELEAEVVLPAGAALDRVEIYRNEELLARLREPPFRASVPGAEAGPSDFVRAAAYLTDGAAAEDVRFLGAGVAGERVEVNLVELFAVVTGKDGEPVEGLTAADFEILVDGKPRPVERFQHADEVPLTLGLAVDTSGSMWPLMIDTSQAASRFLVNTLIPGDRALLVAFSNRPRLVAGPSGDLQTLLQGFGRLSAEGATALYDSIVFSLVQLQETGEDPGGRRAVVLLTDGQDYGSRFRPRRVIDDARAQGTPVYVISLAGLYNERGSVRRPDLESIVGNTGGRIYYIGDVSELARAYAQINRELRTQYALAFATDRPLTDSQLRSLRVEMKRPGLEARVAIEPGR
jgi:Ca-activated chloride channel homolog